jgi:hypothetical protein
MGCPTVVTLSTDAVEAIGKYAKEAYKGFTPTAATQKLLSLCDIHGELLVDFKKTKEGQMSSGACERRVRKYLDQQLKSNKCFIGLPSQMLAIRKCYDCPEGKYTLTSTAAVEPH